MEPTLTKESYEDLKEILQKELGELPIEFSEDLVKDFGLTLLNLTVIAIKRRLKINKQNNTL